MKGQAMVLQPKYNYKLILENMRRVVSQRPFQHIDTLPAQMFSILAVHTVVETGMLVGRKWIHRHWKEHIDPWA